MKTKLEILEETKELYHNNPNKRAYNKTFNSCEYFQETTGNMCAVGRCMKDPKGLHRDLKIKHVRAIASHTNLDDLLKEEYRGHDKEFWRFLQNFHDTYSNWDTNGLTDIGQTRYNVLRNLYENEA